MHFKEFISRQRILIFIFGILAFVGSFIIAHMIGNNSLWSELFIDLAASALTVVFTALIIDYLNLREHNTKTQNAALLAEDEIQATCYRIKWRLARLFGLERSDSDSNNISNREEARDYLKNVTARVDDFLSKRNLLDQESLVHMEAFQRYLDRLQSSQLELEQTLILYEYALTYSLRERVLNLRSELQIAERLLGFVDTSESLNDANLSLVRVTAQSIYDAVEGVLQPSSNNTNLLASEENPII